MRPDRVGLDVADVWAVASMLATYADASGEGIKVAAKTLRVQLRLGDTRHGERSTGSTKPASCPS